MQAQAAAAPPAPVTTAARLRITETFYSLQGEADSVGWPTFFIRLTGCPLRCHYCDTAYAFEGGEWRDLAALVSEASASGARHACVTGGEPLSQKHCLTLLAQLCDAGLQVSLETSGAIDASAVDPLTPRQRETLQLLAEGKSTKEIAHLLGLSVKTVETHRAQIMDRLEIRELAGLVRYAIRVGLVRGDD